VDKYPVREYLRSSNTPTEVTFLLSTPGPEFFLSNRTINIQVFQVSIKIRDEGEAVTLRRPNVKKRLLLPRVTLPTDGPW